MRKNLLNLVEQEMARRRLDNERTEAARKQEIEQKYPVIRALITERENLIHGTLRGILSGKNTADDLPERMKDVSAKIRQALKDNGYAEDYLAPVYQCEKCHDSGYVGEPIREMCSCMLQAYQKKLREDIGLRDDGSETFEKFNLALFPDEKIEGSSFSQRQQMAQVRRICEDWADRWPEQEKQDLILSGKSGLGKTFLLHAIAARLIEKNVNVLLMSTYRFLEIARESYFENDSEPMEELYGTDVLMLDDLGSEPMMQNITIEQLFNLINVRRGRGLSTLISTNLNKKELRERYTERIASRLIDSGYSCFLSLHGEDIRKRKG